MKCKCIEKVNKQLANLGCELETAFVLDFDTGKASVAGPFLAVRWIDKKPRQETDAYLSPALDPVNANAPRRLPVAGPGLLNSLRVREETNE